MTETTLHDDKIGGALAEAMSLIEMTLGPERSFCGIPNDDLIDLAYELIQQARDHYVGREPYPLSDDGAETMAKVAAIDAQESLSSAPQ